MMKRFLTRTALLALILVTLVAGDVTAQGPYSAQIQAGLRTFLATAHTWTGTQTFGDITIGGTCTGCGGGSLNIPSGSALTYNSVNTIRALTASRDYFFGPSGNLTMTGTDNYSLGDNAMVAITSGTKNIAIGTDALSASTTPNSQTAVGYRALKSNTTGDSNTAIGKEALRDNLTGNSNVAVGPASLAVNTSSGNVAVGHSAMSLNTGGTNNTAVGTSAFNTNDAGSNNAALGAEALGGTLSDNNTAVGYRAGKTVTTGGYNTIIGFSSGQTLTTGQANTIIGGQLNTPASNTANNVIIGDGFGVIRFQSDNTGKVALGRLASLTAPTIASGGCTSPAVTWNAGTSAFLITIGTSCSGVKTVVLTLPAATNLWVCQGHNNTSDAQQAANYVTARATSTTAVTITNYTRTTGVQADFTASDTVLLACSGG